MADDIFLTVIQVWAATAWADGKLADSEKHALRRLIDGAELGDDQRQAAFGFLDKPVSLADANLAGMSHESRTGIYRAACRMVIIDRDIAIEERKLLQTLREKLELAPADADPIEQSTFGK